MTLLSRKADYALLILSYLHQHKTGGTARAIAEQINYATASAQFVGDDREMRSKLEALVAELRLNGADQAASELTSPVKMRPHYLALAESIMR